METKTVFNATKGIAVNDQLTLSRAAVLFMYAMCAAGAEIPSIRRTEEGPLPFTGVDELRIPYITARNWYGQFLDDNLLVREMVNAELRSFNAPLVKFIKEQSFAVTNAALATINANDELQFTPAGVEFIEAWGPVLDAELLTIERTVNQLINDRYSHIGAGVTAAFRHVPTLQPAELSRQYVLTDTDVMAATYRRTDGMVLVNVYGVGTYTIEYLAPIAPDILASLADEGMTEKSPSELAEEFSRRNEARAEEFRCANNIRSELDQDGPLDNPAAALAALLGKAMGKTPEVKRIDITPDGVKVKDLGDKVQDAEAVLEAAEKPVS